MTRHTVSSADFINLVLETQLAGSYGEGTHKGLFCFYNLDVCWYEVREKNEVVYKCFCQNKAIEFYNNLP
jgi:hypothetical protein